MLEKSIAVGSRVIKRYLSVACISYILDEIGLIKATLITPTIKTVNKTGYKNPHTDTPDERIITYSLLLLTFQKVIMEATIITKGKTLSMVSGSFVKAYLTT